MDIQSFSRFLLKQQVTLLINRYEYLAFESEADAGSMVAFAEQKRLKLKEELTVYSSENKTVVLFSIKAEKVLDVHGKYFVRDAAGETIGYLRKIFGRSLLRSTWEVYNAQDQLVFMAQESNAFLGVFRRLAGGLPILDFIVMLIPYHFEFVRGAEVVGSHRRRLGIYDHYDINLEPAAAGIDRRLVLALGVGLDALQSR